jgi:hypothetical protein
VWCASSVEFAGIEFANYPRILVSDLSSPQPITLASLLAPGLAAVKKYWRPILLLQASALLLVIGYFSDGHVRMVCQHLSEFKVRAGFTFSAVSAAIAGALLPEAAKALVMGDRVIDRKRVRDVGFALIVFAVMGVIIDLQYRVFGWVIGNDDRPVTIIIKVLADQFITTPIYGVPYFVVVYLLRANRYNVLVTVKELTPRWYATRVMPLMISGWFFWIPMVSLIYSLPGALQFFLFDFALAAWSLLIVFIAAAEPRPVAEVEPGAGLHPLMGNVHATPLPPQDA